jgi:phosphatidylglycerophosphate synthase
VASRAGIQSKRDVGSEKGAVRANSGIIPTAASCFALVVAVSSLLRPLLQLDTLALPRAAAFFFALMLLAIRYIPEHHPFAIFGPANQVTTFRAALVSIVASLVGGPDSAAVAVTAVVLAIVVAALDGVDGWLARRSALSSAFGARFDMETDALLILVLSLLAWHHGKAGAWVLLSGLLRYLFLLAGGLGVWMRRPLCPSRRRQTVCVVQVVALIVVMLPIVHPPLSIWIAGAALAALAYSFTVDTRWLWEQGQQRLLNTHEI